MKTYHLTGGGTAGHVTPNIALLPRLKELQYDIHYIGSYNGIEKRINRASSASLIMEFLPGSSAAISAFRISQILFAY